MIFPCIEHTNVDLYFFFLRSDFSFAFHFDFFGTCRGHPQFSNVKFDFCYYFFQRFGNRTVVYG